MTAPAFTHVDSRRFYNDGIDDEYWDIHAYAFDLDLNDADVLKPVTARLEMADLGSDSWSGCSGGVDSVLSMTMPEGTESTWSVDIEMPLMFDILDLDLEGAEGMFKNIRIACDYTLTDGSAGTVYSTDLQDLYVYKGTFITGISGTLHDNTATGTFKINTGFVSDFGMLEFRKVNYDNSPNYSASYDSSIVSSIAEDGTVTVTYPLTWETFNPEEEAHLYLEYCFTDGTDIIYWVSAGSVTLEVIP